MKAAVIGLGPHGRRIVEVINDIEGVRLEAIVDRRESSLDAFDLPATVARYTSAESFWRAGGSELVCIATNGPSHAPLAVEAMEVGATHVLVEKPMATSVADCDRMIEEARNHGVRLSIDQSRRHDRFYRWLRTTIRSGDLGRPRALWVQRPGIGLGCLATHSFDLVEFLLDAQTKKVTAWVDEPKGHNPRGQQFVDPGGLVVMEFGPELRGVVTQIEDGAGPMSVEIDLTGGRVRIDETSGEVEIIRRDLSVKPGPGRPPRFDKMSLPVGIDARINMFDMLQGVLEELVGEDLPMECDAKWGRRAVEILVASHISSRRGSIPVELPLVSTEEQALCLPVT